MTLPAHVGRLFPSNPQIDSVRTSVHLPAHPEKVWGAMMFYEEIRERPSAMLRWFLPMPVSTHGDKTQIGAEIRCNYDGGYLVKRITGVKEARFVHFDVKLQQLGIEAYVAMCGGSYEMVHAHDGGTEIVLTTKYVGHLRPRWLFRFVEHYLAHRVHRHILRGMRAALDGAQASVGARALART